MFCERVHADSLPEEEDRTKDCRRVGKAELLGAATAGYDDVALHGRADAGAAEAAAAKNAKKQQMFAHLHR